MHAPIDVENGLSCGCICPGCGSRLLAKNRGSKTRPHFAHFDGKEDRRCFETAIHKMAKQVLLGEHEILLPSWSRTASAKDIDGRVHEQQVVREARVWRFDNSADEVWMHGVRPDIVLRSGISPNELTLLVEIRVSHAVTDDKAMLIKARGWAMMEIDLSKICAENLVSDRFREVVLREASNRSWIHSPAGEKAHQHAISVIEHIVQKENAEIERRRTENERRRAAAAAKAIRMEENRKAFRAKCRSKYLDDLSHLEQARTPMAIESRMKMLWARDERSINALASRLFKEAEVPTLFSVHHAQSWIVGAHPNLWQMELFNRFIVGRPIRSVIETNRWAPWLSEQYGFDRHAQRLFKAQQAETKRKRADGYPHYGRYAAWYFDKDENEMIPSPFEVANEFIERLASHRVMDQMFPQRTYQLRPVDGWKDDLRISFIRPQEMHTYREAP